MKPQERMWEETELVCHTTYLGKALTWNESGKMTSFALDGETSATFAYDELRIIL